VVKDMPPGWQIKVVAGHNYSCVFVRATDDELICGTVQRGWISDPREIHFRRDIIREIRVDHGDDANSLAGAAIGGATGVGLAAVASDGCCKGGAALLVGLIGTAIGAHVGHDVHILRGEVVYRSTRPKQKDRGKSGTRAVQVLQKGLLIARTAP
jgi:hypothetical protein